MITINSLIKTLPAPRRKRLYKIIWALIEAEMVLQRKLKEQDPKIVPLKKEKQKRGPSRKTKPTSL